MRVMSAQEFVNLIAQNIPTPYAVAQYNKALNRDLLLISTHINSLIKVTYRKAFSLMSDGTVFFEVNPLPDGAWILDADLIVEHEGQVLFDSSVSNNATDLFALVQLNIEPEFLKNYMQIPNEIKVAQTLLQVRNN